MRGGWGIYMDMAYTNSNALFAASRRHRQGLRRRGLDRQPGGHPQPRRHASTASVSRCANIAEPEPGRPARCRSSASSPTRVCRCRTRVRRRSAGRTSSPTSMVITVDGVRADGRNLNTRPRINVGPVGGGATGARQLAFLGVQPRGDRHASGDQRSGERLHRAHHRLQAPHDQQPRLHRDLHAGQGQQPDRHRGRRAERQQPAGRRRCSTTTTASTVRPRAPTRVTRARWRRSTSSRASRWRRRSSTARRCRWRPSPASTRT